MGKLILWQNVSLDGYVGTDPDDDHAWMSIDAELHDDFNRTAAAAEVLVYGRVSYEIMLSYWPFAEDDPNASEQEREYSRIWKPARKVVLSTTLTDPEWNTTVIADDAASRVAELKESTEGVLATMGGSVTPSFLAREGLLDELRLYVHPAALGGGVPLFSELRRPLRLEPIETRSFGSGVVLLRHRVLND